FPRDVGCLQGVIVRPSILPNSFGDYLLSSQQLAVPEAQQVVACGPCGSPVTFYERVNPVQPPERVCGKQSWMVLDFPVFVDKGIEPVHQIRDLFEVWRAMVPDINRVFPVSPAELRNVRDGSAVQRPKRIFIESLDTLLEADIN